MYRIYAFILNGIVKETYHSLSGVDHAGKVARAVYGDNAIAVDCTYQAVIAGDTYENYKFYHGGVEVASSYDPAIEIDALRQQLGQQSNDIDDLIVMVAEG